VWSPPAAQNADFTGDGILDRVFVDNHYVGGYLFGDLVVWPGRGDGTFGDPIRSDSGMSVTYGPDAVLAVADFNGDDRLDVFTASPTGGWSGLDAPPPGFGVAWLGRGDGTFHLEGVYTLGVAWPIGIGTVDFHGTGGADVVIAAQPDWSYPFEVLFNDGGWPPLSPPPPPGPTIDVGDVTVTEGNSGTKRAAFIVTLSASSAQPVTVAYATAPSPASPGDGYQYGSGTLVIPAGQTTGTITVQVIGDRRAEWNETFFVNLSNPVNARIGDGQGVGTILDDEPRVSISDATKSEGKKNEKTLFTFTVTLSAAYDQPVTLSFRTAGGSATTGDGDYVARTGKLTFAPGETTKTITIEVKGDSKREANETFYLDLTGLSSNGILTKNRGIGTILNDD
jgi:hypothetical protein